jgi:hypothetical protein
MDELNGLELMAVKFLYYLHLVTKSVDIFLNLEAGLSKRIKC